LWATLFATLPKTRPIPLMRRLPTTIIRAPVRSASRIRASAGLPRAAAYVTVMSGRRRPSATERATVSALPASETIHWSLPLPKTCVLSLSKALTT